MPRKAAKPTPAKPADYSNLALLEAVSAKRPRAKMLTAAIVGVLDALELPPRMKLKILADCADRICEQSLTKAERAERRKAAGRTEHGVFS